MSEPVIGRRPRDDEDYWDRAAADLTPSRSLDRIDSTVNFVFGNVTLVVSLVTGLGLLAGTTARLSSYDTEVRAILGLLAVALFLALLAAAPVMVRKLHTGRVDSVRKYYTRRIKVRGALAALAMAALSGAFLVGLAVTFRSLDDRTPPSLALQWRSSSPPAVVVAVRGQVPVGLVAETRLTELTGGREGAELLRDKSEVDATGKLEVTATVTADADTRAYRLSTTLYEGDSVWGESVHVDLVVPRS